MQAFLHGIKVVLLKDAVVLGFKVSFIVPIPKDDKVFSQQTGGGHLPNVFKRFFFNICLFCCSGFKFLLKCLFFSSSLICPIQPFDFFNYYYFSLWFSGINFLFEMGFKLFKLLFSPLGGGLKAFPGL